jgi:hypothetical protein
MKDLPPLPLTPAHLPQQRLVEVVAMPPRPASFDPVACLFWMPDDILPRRRPRRMTCLGTVEWAWAPGASRIETYWLHRARRHWVVWIQDRDWLNDPDYRWQVAAYAPRRGVDPVAAAAHLVAARWEEERDDRSLDHFHMISSEGLLDVALWRAVGRAVWG